METKKVISGPLNEQQLLMLLLLKKPLPEDDFIQIRKLTVELLTKQLDETIEEWENKNGITEEYYRQMGTQHFRSYSKKR